MEDCYFDMEERDELRREIINIMLLHLKKDGYRITNQRKIILEAIATNVGWSVHPKQVHMHANEKDKNIGIATVYRTIKLLDSINLLSKVYEMARKNHNTSYKLVCLNCGKIAEVSDSLSDEIIEKLKKDYNFSTTNLNFMAYGLCVSCKKYRSIKDKQSY